MGTSADFPSTNSKTNIWRTYQIRSDGGNVEQVTEEMRDAEMEQNIKHKKKSKNPPGYRVARYKRTAEEIEAGIKSRPYNQREPSELALTAPESDGDTSGRFGLSLPRVNTPSTDSIDQKPSSPACTPYQGKAKLGWGLDDATRKMLMDAGIGIANPICRCPCHRGDSHDHAVQQCHCMSKEALTKKYWEENSIF